MSIQFLETKLLQVFPDESLHSYVLRVVISHGLANHPNDIIGIISPSGIIKTDLILTEQQAKIFSTFPVTTLMELLKNHMPLVGDSEYLNPKFFATICGRIFFHSATDVSKRDTLDFEGHLKSKFSLCYCPACVKEQIQEYGSGWFKLNWLISQKCDVHNLDLVSIKQQACSCKLNILDKVILALSGICASCKSEAIFPPKNTPLTLFQTVVFNPKTFGNNRGITMSACFVRGFEKWGRDLYLGSHEDVNQYAHINSTAFNALGAFTYLGEGDKYVTLGRLLYVMDIFERYAYDHFCDFLDKKTEILKIDCSDCVPDQIFVDYKVAKDRDCATCRVKRRECPLKTELMPIDRLSNEYFLFRLYYSALT